jgi:hypothetical protein
MVDQLLGKRLAPVGIIYRDLVRAYRDAMPAHTMRKARGAEANLRIFEAFARLPQHLVGGDAQIVDLDFRMAAGHGIVDRVEHAHRPDRRVGQIDHEHAGATIGGSALRPGHDDTNTCAISAGDELLAPVHDPVVPV